MIIRLETPADIEAIDAVTIAAFENHPFSQQTEQFIVKALRSAVALTLSLVAELDGQVVGHIAFSPATISDGSLNWHGLGPISVLPAYKRQGIGKALMQEGLSSLKALGSNGCVLVGPPEYYHRFGFRNIPEIIHEGIPQEVFLALPFTEKIPQGAVVFHQGFSATS
ncbi:MAG: N-acetyltransferase [Desulfurivibrio sp.]|jgi:putative acetyltransferase|nr:MAG: N-acetyltransferase [Desulfurivibrio sp.]